MANRKTKTQHIDELKAAVKAEIDSIDDLRQRASFLWKIVTEEKGSEKTDLLRRAIAIVHLVLLNREDEVLPTQQLKQLRELFYGTMVAAGVPVGSPGFGTLFHDFHLAMSQNHWRNHDWFASQWQQGLARQLLVSPQPRVRALDKLASGIRMARCGIGDIAEKELSSIDLQLLSARNAARTILNLIRLNRCTGNLDRAVQICDDLLSKTNDLDRDLLEETHWEKLLNQHAVDGSIEALRHSVGPGGMHRQGSYILEYFLIHMTTPNLVGDKVPSLKSFVNQKLLIPNEHGDFYKIVRTLVECHRDDEPVLFRTQLLGEALSDLHRVPTIYLEISILNAAATWLHSVGMEDLHDVCRRLANLRVQSLQGNRP